ncbi:MAG TPA: S8 family serine peptidase [Solirubrobacteraceae bacterium]|jgi:streptogramin lyase|nr:S8 family serine peptidase [Solirubrobacteraceae bacterium]
MTRVCSAAVRQGGLGRRSWLFAAATAIALLGACLWSTAASASYEHVCSPTASTEDAMCYVLLDKTEEGVKTYTSGSGELGGFSPSDLRSAYKLPAKGGYGQTVAIVDAYNDPNAESDLAEYRAHYKLPECTKADGCFRKVNQKGEERAYPEESPGWSLEISLDLDMVSAVCPGCHILLVEASSEKMRELGASDNEAATLGATEISNSYGSPEEWDPKHEGYREYDSDYEHPGVPITVAAGDYGYDNWELEFYTGEKVMSPSFPAASPDAISVGGTTLLPAEGVREWAETVWTSSGGGCSLEQERHLWQAFYAGCELRMDNDVAAVADPATPMSIYDTYGIREKWHDVGGTSVAAPLIAGLEALSGSRARSLPGAEALYLGSGAMFDVKVGTNNDREVGCGQASNCNAGVGYDGPSGNGTPDGLLTVPPAASEYALPSGSEPLGAAAGPDGNLWFALEGAGKIAKVTPSGAVTEYKLGSSSACPSYLTAGPAGEGALWFTDKCLSKIGKITTAGTVTEYALPSGSLPYGIAAGPDGNLWFAELGTNRIGKITTAGTVTEYKLPSRSDPVGIAAGPDGKLWFTEFGSNRVGKIATSGSITEYNLPSGSQPGLIAAGPEKEGALWFPESGTSRIGKIATSGTISEYALPAGSDPIEVADGPEGDLWFTDYGTSKVGRILRSGGVVEFALPAGSDPGGLVTGPDGDLWVTDTGAAKVSKLKLTEVSEYGLPSGSEPLGAAAGPDGNLWVALEGAGKIAKVTPSGAMTEYTLGSSSACPSYIAAGPSDESALWFTDKCLSKIGKITTAGTVTEYALPSGSLPYGIAAGPDGNLWFAELGTNRVGKITTSGTVTEYKLPARSDPVGIAAGTDGNLWFTEFGTSRVGKITTSGTITEYTLPSGSRPGLIAPGPEREGALWFAESGTSKIGTITTSGSISEYALPAGADPIEVADGPEGDLWFTDFGTSKAGRITTSGMVSEFELPAGSDPGGLVTGPDGDLWLTDTGSGQIGRLAPP